uniref:hypothetical protein n=1 Tax=Pseudomonas sp. H26/SER47-MNA-CIBAN-0231 TaxID=3140477 RepID=UPI00331ACB44
MKTHLFTPAKPTRYLRVLTVIFLSMFLVTACEKSSESETVNGTTTDAAVQTTPVTSNINVPEVTDREANAAETTVD